MVTNELRVDCTDTGGGSKAKIKVGLCAEEELVLKWWRCGYSDSRVITKKLLIYI